MMGTKLFHIQTPSADVENRYYQELGKLLQEELQSGPTNLQDMITECLPRLSKIARRYSTALGIEGIDHTDLIQLGALVLIELFLAR